MPVHNADIADVLSEMADLLEIEEADAFRVRAYRRAARSIENLSEALSDMVERGDDLTELPGIGKSMAEKIREMVQTGHLKQFEQIKQEVPEELSGLMELQGLGPKKVEKLYHELGIKSANDLREALEAHRIRELEGFGEKTEQNLMEELKRSAGRQKRTLIARAEEYTEPLVNYLQSIKGVGRVTVAGSYRRRKETVGDIDILVTCGKAEKVMDHFTGYDDVDKVINQGSTKSSVLLKNGLQVDLRVVKEQSYGAALLYFTGSKDHNIRIRERAVSRGMKLNEYGLFKEDSDRSLAGKTEEAMYDALELAYIEPELREDHGEVEAAGKGKLPRLVKLEDIKGDLHAHTDWSDGADEIRVMAKAAQDMGYRYLGITDHSKRVTVANGLDADRLARQIDEIDKVQEDFKKLKLLRGCEVDILQDGTLDLPDAILERLDYTVCSVHYQFNLPRDKQTERIIRAMDHPAFNILAHPTGRQMPERGEMELGMERLMDAALERGCFMEINANPRRLDLRDRYCRMARERGLKLLINTDAHSTQNLQFMRYGIDQARRGWLEAGDILNTLPLKKLLKLLKQ